MLLHTVMYQNFLVEIVEAFMWRNKWQLNQKSSTNLLRVQNPILIGNSKNPEFIKPESERQIPFIQIQTTIK